MGMEAGAAAAGGRLAARHWTGSVGFWGSLYVDDVGAGPPHFVECENDEKRQGLQSGDGHGCVAVKVEGSPQHVW